MTKKSADRIAEEMAIQKHIDKYIRSLRQEIIFKIDNDECIFTFNGEMTHRDKLSCLGKYIKKIASDFTLNSTTDDVVAYMNKYIEDCLKINKDLDCLKLKNP